MGKMEQTLKSELTRLAKKQRRATCLPLARDVRQLKQIVSALRKMAVVLSRLGSELEAQRTAARANLTSVSTV